MTVQCKTMATAFYFYNWNCFALSNQKSTALLISLEERKLMLLVTNLWRNDAGEMSMSEDSKQKAWLEHYQRLLNVEFDWDPDHLSYQPPVEGPPIPITIDMVKKAISQMKAGEAPGPSGIVVEMIRAAGDMGASMIRDLAAAIIRDGKVPSDWEQSFIVCLFKGKGDALERGNYHGLDRAGYENPGEDCGRPHQTVGVNRRFPVWLPPRQTQSLLSGSCKRSI